jgi:hypothetical protein
MRTSFHHQPEAQHPKSSAINKNAGRLPHLCAINVTSHRSKTASLFDHLVGVGDFGHLIALYRMSGSGK